MNLREFKLKLARQLSNEPVEWRRLKWSNRNGSLYVAQGQLDVRRRRETSTACLHDDHDGVCRTSSNSDDWVADIGAGRCRTQPSCGRRLQCRGSLSGIEVPTAGTVAYAPALGQVRRPAWHGLTVTPWCALPPAFFACQQRADGPRGVNHRGRRSSRPEIRFPKSPRI